MTSPSPPEMLAPADWPEGLKQELAERHENGAVGDTLLSETDDVRVWRIALRPGERYGFHRHVLNYFWVAVTGGRSRSHYAGGETREQIYRAGDVRHYRFARGEFMVHDIENIGDGDLIFTTVELKASENAPLPLDRAQGDERR